MGSGRLIFDSSSSSHPGHMLILGGPEHSIFRGARSMLSMEEGGTKRLRPFFTSSEELLEEEYYDGQLPEKKRRLTPEQVHMLERSFEAENRLEPERKSELAKQLGLQPRQVAVWFQNRRARWKSKQLEHDYDRLKAAYDSLLANHNSLLDDNDHLRSQIACLSEKLHTNEVRGEEPIGDSTVDKINAISPTNDANKSDQLSTGSGGSAVVDGAGLQLVESCGSEYYFHDEFEVNVGATIGIVRCCGVHSEGEDVGSDDGCNYLPAGGGLMLGDHNPDDDVAGNNWWGVWNCS